MRTPMIRKARIVYLPVTLHELKNDSVKITGRSPELSKPKPLDVKGQMTPISELDPPTITESLENFG